MHSFLIIPTNTQKLHLHAILVRSVSVGLPRLPDNIQLINTRYTTRKTVLISMRQLPYDCSVKPYCKSDNNMVRLDLKI